MNMPRELLLACCAGVAVLAGLAWRRRRRSRCFGFDAPVDRSCVHTVKHDLAAILYGEAAACALPMWVADMELPCCAHIQRAIAERARHPTFGYTVQPREIWESVGRWMVERQGWCRAPKPASFVFSASVVTSFCNVLEALTAAGDTVVVMTPLYAPLQHAVVGTGRRLVRHALRLSERSGRYEMDMAALEAQLDGAHCLLLCSPHNPSGRMWRRDELRAVCAACAARRVLLVADEIWADWALPGCDVAFVPCAALAAEAGCALVTLGAPTKSWSLAGLHASFVVIDDDEMRRR
jgi:cystathionine beta-lyase